jgi:hypothetical protein
LALSRHGLRPSDQVVINYVGNLTIVRDDYDIAAIELGCYNRDEWPHSDDLGPNPPRARFGWFSGERPKPRRRRKV